MAFLGTEPIRAKVVNDIILEEIIDGLEYNISYSDGNDTINQLQNLTIRVRSSIRK